jgi:hypothetical protein
MLSGAAMHKMSFEMGGKPKPKGGRKALVWPILVPAAVVVCLAWALAPMVLAWLRQ